MEKLLIEHKRRAVYFERSKHGSERGLCKPIAEMQQGGTFLLYVFAASQIYTMLRSHKGKITVKIDSLAASAASVVAMAGDDVFISPTGMLMMHDPSTIAFGNKADMEKAIALLDEVKESIINAYEEKTHLSRSKIAKLMSDETWLNAKKALQLGFVDGILFNEETHEKVNPDESSENTSEYQKIDSFADKKAETDSNTADFRSRNTAEMIYTPMHTAASFMQRVSASAVSRTVPFEQLEKRLELLKYWR